MRMGFIGPVQDRTDLFRFAFELVGFDLFDVSISGSYHLGFVNPRAFAWNFKIRAGRLLSRVCVIG